MGSIDSFAKFSEFEKNYILPSPDLIFHTCGHRNPKQYMESGWNHAAHFLVLNNLISGYDFSDYRRILDFGCGAGRLLNSMPFNEAASVFACDVSEKCVDNVQKYFGWVNAQISGLMPPLLYPSNYFDCIYSFSVFSHLSQPVENSFLEELHRIGQKGCIYIISFHGIHGKEVRLTETEIDMLEREGFYFKKVHGAGAHPEYYEASHHTWDYLRNNWTKYFDILEIVKGGDIRDAIKSRLPENGYSDLMANLRQIGQDIAVLRKR